MGQRHHSIDYIEISVTNIADAKRFYADAFGWRFTGYGPGYAGIRRSDDEDREMGGLSVTENVKPGGPLVVLYSEDLDDSERRVREAGGTITTPPFDFPGGRRFHFTDPSRNELAVWSTVLNPGAPGRA